MSEDTITDEATADNVNAWDATELERKGVSNLDENELNAYIAWKAKLKAQELYNQQAAENAEQLQKELETKEETEWRESREAFESQVNSMLEKLQARLGE